MTNIFIVTKKNSENGKIIFLKAFKQYDAAEKDCKGNDSIFTTELK